MNKSGEFEKSFTPITNIDVTRFKKETGERVKYFLGANVFNILSNGNLVISSPTCIVHINCDTWMIRPKVLSENSSSVNVFLSVLEERKGIECCYECELPIF